MYMNPSFINISCLVFICVPVNALTSHVNTLSLPRPTFLAISSRRSVPVSKSSSCLSHSTRREFAEKIWSGHITYPLAHILATGGITSTVALAADESNVLLTNDSFNPDGSLKGEALANGMNRNEAKSKVISVAFPNSARETIVSVDGVNPEFSLSTTLPSSSPTSLLASYSIPVKWTDAPAYLDTFSKNERGVAQKACERITVYQTPTGGDESILERATLIGVAKAVGFLSPGGLVERNFVPASVQRADIISGKKVDKPIQKSDSTSGATRRYFEFDLAVAPDTCEKSADNLGLGFCPYDSILLLSATVVNGSLMVCSVSCSREEWKIANADLKRVRESFFVESTII